MSSSFRAKVKRAFGRQGERGSDSSQEKSARKAKKQKNEYPDNVYKPGEVMPKLKYGATPNRAHQAKLSAFSFDDAWKRRTSVQSQYSPRGSRLPSTAEGHRRRSFMPGLRSRRASVVDGGRLEENMDRDDDVGNVGLSSNPPHTARSENIQRPTGTADSSTAPPRRDETHDSTTTSMQAPLAYSEMGMPFTEAELTLALTRTSIRS